VRARSGNFDLLFRCHRLLLVALLFIPLAYAQDVHVRVSPDVKTGIEGTTEFPTIQMALDHHPFPGAGLDGKPGRVFIEIEPGIYHERVNVTQNHPSITLVGMGKSPEDAVITNSLNAKQAGGTFFTETVEVNGLGFEADNLTFENTAGNTGQAVAIVVRADRSIFKRCRFLGHQDTLFADYGRQYYVDSYIEGGVDFIFGNATAVFDHSEIRANAPGYLTAQSRTSPDQTTGYVIIDSKVTSGIDHSSESSTGQARQTISLGRPWRPYSRVVYINTWLPADLLSQGWSAWGKNPEEPKVYYAEFNSNGPGARPAARVAWSHQLDAATAAQFRPEVFLAGPDHWDAKSEARKLP
jgi:pectinesterase